MAVENPITTPDFVSPITDCEFVSDALAAGYDVISSDRLGRIAKGLTCITRLSELSRRFDLERATATVADDGETGFAVISDGMADHLIESIGLLSQLLVRDVQDVIQFGRRGSHA